jgi:hypothetical protein
MMHLARWRQGFPGKPRKARIIAADYQETPAKEEWFFLPSSMGGWRGGFSTTAGRSIIVNYM